MDNDILNKVCHADSLPAQPVVALEVLRLTRTDDAGLDDLIRVIQTDASLTARILKIVNSSLYALSTKVATIKQAVIALGLRSVQVIAISLSLVDAVRKTDDGQAAFDYPRYWRRTLSTAVAARLLAAHLDPQNADDAFVAGLLADIGMAAAWHAARDQYEPALQAANNSPKALVDFENDMFGLTHAEMGAAMLRAWGLPDSLCQVVGVHHGFGLDRLAPDAAKIAVIVRAADLLAAVFCRDLPPQKMIEIREQVVDLLDIDPFELEYILEEIEPAVNETSTVFSVKLGPTVNYAEISADAALRLAELNAAALVERDQSIKREAQAARECDRLQQLNRVIRAAARTDGLTSVANRAAFDRRLTREIAAAKRKNLPLGLIMLDVDNFKLFNDEHGHQAGDQVLRELAACLKELTDRVGYVARYGGEEFAVILAQQTADRARDLAEEIRAAVEARQIRCGDQELHATVSLGVACFNPREESLDDADLIESADKCLYQAKRAGRNRVVSANDAPATPSANDDSSSIISRLVKKFRRPPQ